MNILNIELERLRIVLLYRDMNIFHILFSHSPHSPPPPLCRSVSGVSVYSNVRRRFSFDFILLFDLFHVLNAVHSCHFSLIPIIHMSKQQADTWNHKYNGPTDSFFVDEENPAPDIF